MKLKTVKTLQETQELQQIWLELDASMRFGDLNPDKVTAQSTTCRQLLDMFTNLDSQIKAVRTRLKKEEKVMSQYNTRICQGMRGSYGAESPEYLRAQKARIQKPSARRAANTPSSPVPPPQA